METVGNYGNRWDVGIDFGDAGAYPGNLLYFRRQKESGRRRNLMKMVFMSFFEEKTDEVLQLLESEQVAFYTHWTKTQKKAAGFHPQIKTQI